VHTNKHHQWIIDFNPRSRTGSDYVQWYRCRCVSISIHAPERGATAPPTVNTADNRYFNPRSRTGSDPAENGMTYTPRDFNPRSRTGSDVAVRRWDFAATDFNPRSRTGSDYWRLTGNSYWFLFQSTLPNGERLQFRSL